jgi:site-specific DNA-methyltransferase (adenine-specific)
MQKIEINKIYNEDCITGMQRIPDGLVDVILTDPPYMYLTQHKFDRPFNETAFFTECKRVLKKDAILVLFGRGASFYRWNVMIEERGFEFKEEIIWDKRLTSSPVAALKRMHETVSIHSIGKKRIEKSMIPFCEKHHHEPQKIYDILRRMRAAFGNRESYKQIEEYYKNGIITYRMGKVKYALSIDADYERDQDRCLSAARTIEEGAHESSIISVIRDHYTSVHPTQKPVRLIERLLLLTSVAGALVLDPFAGSGSTCIAARRCGRDFLGFEIDEEYYDAACKRISAEPARLF